MYCIRELTRTRDEVVPFQRLPRPSFCPIFMSPSERLDIYKNLAILSLFLLRLNTVESYKTFQWLDFGCWDEGPGVLMTPVKGIRVGVGLIKTSVKVTDQSGIRFFRFFCPLLHLQPEVHDPERICEKDICRT